MEPRRRLLSLLARLELTPQQVVRIANPDKRSSCGISASDEQLIANPYLLSEMDQGDGESDLIALEIVDRAMRPEGAAARFIERQKSVCRMILAECRVLPLPCCKGRRSKVTPCSHLPKPSIASSNAFLSAALAVLTRI